MIDWQSLPCREFCNHSAKGCAPGACRNPYDLEDPRRWLGRGSEPVGGKPFGWAKIMQEKAIFDHLRERGINPRTGEAYFYTRKLIQRLERDYNRRKPPMGVRRIGPARPPSPSFSDDELEHLAQLFADANDPTSRSIAEKAHAILEWRTK